MTNIDYINIILGCIILSLSILSGIRYFFLNKFNKTRFINLYSFFFICFGYGIIIDYSRVIFAPWFGMITIEIDTFFFLSKYFFILLGVFFVIQIFNLISDYVERDFKHAKALQAYSLGLTTFFSVINVFTYYQTVSDPSGYFMFQSNFYIFIILISLLFPVGIYLIYRNTVILKKVNNDKIRRDIKFIMFIASALIIERGYNFAFIGLFYYNFYVSLSVSMITDSCLLIFIFICFTAFEIKYPKTMERISMHFSVKAVYLIKKTGQLLFEYNFEEDKEKSPDSLVVGGFIYAVTSGIKNMLKLKKEITSFTTKKRSVLVQHGDQVFGVLIVRENAQILHDNLIKFITNYEKKYQKMLEDWSGRVPSPESEDVINWVHELFRKKEKNRLD